MVKSPRLLLIGTSLLLLAGIRSAQAAETKIVSPGDYEFREGEGGYLSGASGPFRGQQVFPAEEFAALEGKPHWLVNDTFRPDQSLEIPLTVLFPDNQFRYATMPVGPPNLSPVFDDNLGSDFKDFYRGAWTLVADASGARPGPREFYDSNYPAGVTPYLYDPSQGNLLLDFIGWQGASPSSGDEVPGMQTVLYGSSPFATQGVPGAAHVHQFTFIPVIPGDYNVSGAVEQADLDLVLLNWGQGGTTPPAGWFNDLPVGDIDQAELDGVLLNWGNAAAPLLAGSVPEPSSLILFAVLLVFGSLCPRATIFKTAPSMPKA